MLDLARANGQLASTDPTGCCVCSGYQESPQLTGSVRRERAIRCSTSYCLAEPGDQTEKQPALRSTTTSATTIGFRPPTTISSGRARRTDHRTAATRGSRGRRTTAGTTTRPIAVDCAALDARRTTWSASCAAASRAASGCSSASPEQDAPTLATLQRHERICDRSVDDAGSRQRVTNWHVTNTLVVAQRLPYHARRTLNWLKGKHSITHRRRRVPRPGVGGLQQLVPGIDLRFDTTNDPATPLVHDDQLPGRVGRRSSPTPATCTRCSRAASAP